MIYLLITILALIILLAIQYFSFAKREKNLTEFWTNMLSSEKANSQNEKEMLLDRIMARNFEELKTEQSREKSEPMEEKPENLVPAEEMTDNDWRNVEGKEEEEKEILE